MLLAALATTLAVTLSIPIWGVLLIITVLTFIMAAMFESKHGGGGYIPFPTAAGPLWLFGNLVMWLIYFIIV